MDLARHRKERDCVDFESGNSDVGRKTRTNSRESLHAERTRNFSADWMRRTDLDKVIGWGRTNGFRRLRFQARRDEFIAEWKTKPSEGWGPGPIFLERKIPRFSGKCVEWNSAGGGLARSAMEMGIPVEYIYPRHAAAVEWVAKNHGFQPHTGGGVDFRGGSAQTEGEISQFKWAIETYQPRIAVIMVPLGIELDGDAWGRVHIADSAQHGDVLAGIWQIGLKNLVPIHCFVEETVNHPLCTILERFDRCGLIPCGDRRGIVDTHELPYCAGLEVWIRSDTGVRTLSLNSHIRLLGLNDLAMRGIKLPRCLRGR